jgi:hypothetical protein
MFKLPANSAGRFSSLGKARQGARPNDVETRQDRCLRECLFETYLENTAGLGRKNWLARSRRRCLKACRVLRMTDDGEVVICRKATVNNHVAL